MEPTETNELQQKTPWLSRVSPVLLSIVLSSTISAAAVSIGWKASIDTFDAVLGLKTQENADRLDKLDRDTVKTSDMVYRDQLLDSKLQLLSIKITTLDDKITELSARKAGR